MYLTALDFCNFHSKLVLKKISSLNLINEFLFNHLFYTSDQKIDFAKSVKNVAKNFRSYRLCLIIHDKEIF